MRRAPSAPTLPRTAPLVSIPPSSVTPFDRASRESMVNEGNDLARPPALQVYSPLQSPNASRVRFANVPSSVGHGRSESASSIGAQVAQPASETRAAASSEIRATVLSELLTSITDPADLYNDDMNILPAMRRWLEQGKSSQARKQEGGARGHDRRVRRASGNGQLHEQSRAVVDVRDQHGSTLLMVACCFGKVNCVRQLLSSGASVDLVNGSGRSALVYACLGPELPQRLEILDMLIRAGSSRTLASALMAAAQLGRLPLINRLAAAGALSPGQICRLVCPAHADLHRAMCSVVNFDCARELYRIVVVSPTVLSGDSPSRQKERAVQIDVRPDQLSVALHHLGTEYAHPVLAAGNPLDIAAGSLAGVPPTCLTQTETASKASDEAVRRQRQAHTIAPGMSVRVIGRPELWLRERVGRIHSWDAATGRYMVLLEQSPELHPASISNHASEDEIIGEVPLMLRAHHIEPVCEARGGPEAQPAADGPAVPAGAAAPSGSTSSHAGSRSASGCSPSASGCSRSAFGCSATAPPRQICWPDMLL